MTDPDDLFLFRNIVLNRRGGRLFRRDGNGDLSPVPIGARAGRSLCLGHQQLDPEGGDQNVVSARPRRARACGLL